MARAEDVWEVRCRRPAQMLSLAWHSWGGVKKWYFAPAGGIDFTEIYRTRYRCSFLVLLRVYRSSCCMADRVPSPWSRGGGRGTVGMSPSGVKRQGSHMPSSSRFLRTFVKTSLSAADALKEQLMPIQMTLGGWAGVGGPVSTLAPLPLPWLAVGYVLPGEPCPHGSSIASSSWGHMGCWVPAGQQASPST